MVMERITKDASVPYLVECVAAIKIKTCLYLQNKRNKLVSENIGGNIF